MDRRKFIKASSVAVAGTPILSSAASATNAINAKTQDDTKKPTRPAVIATWPFGKPACELAIKTASSKTMLDGIEQGIRIVEADVSNASVGIGGIPNSDGVVELDACIMAGPGHKAGSVAGIQNIVHPISVARLVMEKTRHVLLVGEGAKKFALEQGFEEKELTTAKQRERWEAWKKEQEKKPAKIDEDQHDTIAMVGVDEKGDVYGGCSTSGLGYKMPGRVGDSPILGSGLYVDNAVGGAGATGVGENVMRFCGSFLIVEFMRAGLKPTAACEKAIRRIAEMDPLRIDQLDINFIAINKQGEMGAAGTSKGFKYAFADKENSGVVSAKSLSAKPIGPEGGNQPDASKQ